MPPGTGGSSSRKVEEKLRIAAEAYRRGDYGTNLTKCARELGVSYHTLRRRILNLTKSHSESHEGQAYLTTAQEDALRAWLIYNGATGHANSMGTVRVTAQRIAQKEHPPSKQWFVRFRQRHPDIIAAKPSPLDPKRAKAFNKDTVRRHLEKLKEFLMEMGIEWRDVWNMDEKGCQLGGGRKNNGRKYIFPRSQRNRYRLRDENLELMTIIECISATGDFLPPGFIFAGKKCCPDWFHKEETVL